MHNKKTKLVAKILSATMILTLFGGYTNFITNVKAASNSITAYEQTSDNISDFPNENPDSADPYAFDLVAHRGYSGEAPENSIVAFEKAALAGFSRIELDIRRCKPDASGKAVWVVSHNDSLKSTMGVNVNISDTTYGDLLKYSYKSGNKIEAYNNLKIVSLEEVIELIKKYKDMGKNINWQIELKTVSDANYTDYFENEIIAPLKEADVINCVTFLSFSKSYLKAIKNINPDATTIYLSTILDEDTIIDAQQCDASGITFNGEKNYTTEKNIKLALKYGFKVGVYTLDSPVIMGVYYLWGVRAFTTNTITPNDVSKDSLSSTYNTNLFTCTLSNTKYTYDGSRKLPKVTVTYKNVPLIEGINYQLSYTDNKNPGSARVYISGINNCTDEKSLKYKIVMPEVSGFNDSTTTTSKVKLKWNAVKNVTGYVIYKYNYTTKKYETLKNIENVNTTSYNIKKLATASKYRYRMATYLKTDDKTYYSEPCSGKTTYTKPAAIKVTTIRRYKKNTRLKVKWSNSPRCSGYEVKVSTDKKMKNVIRKYTTYGNTTQSIKVKKLSKTKTYYVKVRAYLKVGNAYYYSSYSTVVKSKPLKIKKKK